jgi:excisionase family DNA binding protein
MPEDELPIRNTIGYRDPDWVADQLGLDKQTVYKYLQDGTLPGLQLGRKWLISEKALIAHLDDLQRRQTAARRAGAPDAPEGFMSRIQDDASTLGVLAETEARRRYHNYIGQEHLLLAIADSPQCAAARALATMGIDDKRLRASVELVVGPGSPDGSGDTAAISLTPRAKRAMELAAVAAAQAGKSISSTHVLLGIVGEGTGVGAAVLRALGVEPDRLATAIAQVTTSPSPPES